METGTVIKIISNQYTLQTDRGQVTAVPAGKLRKDRKPAVGDHVMFDQVDDTCRIQSIEPRRNMLLRPAVANVDQALVVTSCKDPDYSPRLMDRLLILSELANVEPVILLTKGDLVSENRLTEIREQLQEYAASGYRVFESWPGTNDDLLADLLKDRITVLCGQSGAGKSSLLNRLEPDFHLQTQEISKALGRGRHTTRHCELHTVGDGLVADTPGFSSLDFSRLDVSDLDKKIHAFSPYIGHCRFADCRHLNEPDCAVKEAVEQGKIPKLLYEDYRVIREEERKR